MFENTAFDKELVVESAMEAYNDWNLDMEEAMKVALLEAAIDAKHPDTDTDMDMDFDF
jgi:hypothetical protein